MYERELKVALQAAGKAGRFLVQEYENFKAIPNAPASITTAADLQVQEVILQHLLGQFPDDALCAEEATASVQNAKKTGERMWIVDPIDGTRGFAQKNGEFSVMIGFLHQGEIGVGVVLQPAVGRLTYASKGEGCWRLDGKDTTPLPCRVNEIDKLSEATLTKSRSRTPGKKSAQVEALAPAKILESYSAGIKLALVARGEADLYVNSYDAFHDWDICAGHILVTEAGGLVTGLRSEPLLYGQEGAWQRHGLLASNGRLHEEAVSRLKV